MHEHMEGRALSSSDDTYLDAHLVESVELLSSRGV